jgi:hypothetical protein
VEEEVAMPAEAVVVFTAAEEALVVAEATTEAEAMVAGPMAENTAAITAATVDLRVVAMKAEATQADPPATAAVAMAEA